jgi:hypothetical protein
MYHNAPFDYDEDLPELYDHVEDLIIDKTTSAGLNISSVNEDVHQYAVNQYIHDQIPSGLQRKISRSLEEDTGYEDRIGFENVVESYVKNVRNQDMRSDHQRAVDAEIEEALSDHSVHDYDMVFKELDFIDPSEEPTSQKYEDLNVQVMFDKPGPISDADFLGVNLTPELEDTEGIIDFTEVKQSNDYKFRENRQKEQFKTAVELANEYAGTSFNVSVGETHAPEILSINMLPEVYKGDYRPSEELSGKELDSFIDFMNELIHEGQLEDLTGLKNVTERRFSRS